MLKILCLFGIHKWEIKKVLEVSHKGKRIIIETICKRCGIIK